LEKARGPAAPERVGGESNRIRERGRGQGKKTVWPAYDVWWHRTRGDRGVNIAWSKKKTISANGV